MASHRFLTVISATFNSAGQFLVSISLESMLEEILFGQRKVKTRRREEKECSAKRPHRMCQCFFSCKSNQVRSMPSKSAMERYFTAPRSEDPPARRRYGYQKGM